jgi:tRNA (guanine37-N1)-methyltransferase
MQVDVFTIFPQIFTSPLKEGLLGKAQERGVVRIRVHDIRDYAMDKHRQVDDAPFGGGPGMVLKPEPIFSAVLKTYDRELEELEELKREVRIVLMTPRGRRLDQSLVQKLAREERLAIICGRYEGVDERVREHLCTDSISIGDYVLSGGEMAALVLIDCVARLIPGVVGNVQSLELESFTSGLLEYPQYTRPADFHGWKVPEVLLSGNHREIERWRMMQARKITEELRPDLLGD